MRRRSGSQASGWVAALLVTTAPIHAADKPAPVDEDFLDYLGTVDDDGGDWTLFEEQEKKPPPETHKPASKPAEDDAKSASKPK